MQGRRAAKAAENKRKSPRRNPGAFFTFRRSRITTAAGRFFMLIFAPKTLKKSRKKLKTAQKNGRFFSVKFWATEKNLRQIFRSNFGCQILKLGQILPSNSAVRFRQRTFVEERGDLVPGFCSVVGHYRLDLDSLLVCDPTLA